MIPGIQSVIEMVKPDAADTLIHYSVAGIYTHCVLYISTSSHTALSGDSAMLAALERWRINVMIYHLHNDEDPLVINCITTYRYMPEHMLRPTSYATDYSHDKW